MAKVLMINPTIREEDDPKHIPYGITELAGIAVEKGHQVVIYDDNAWRKGPEIIAKVCQADDWDVIAIGGLTTAYGSIKRTLKIAKAVAPKAFLIAGGGDGFQQLRRGPIPFALPEAFRAVEPPFPW